MVREQESRTDALPVEQVREAFMQALERGPVVLSSPTGSGKSTQVPRWCLAAGMRTLVVEPRRVACSSLAGRVAELEGVPVGGPVGYQVRDARAATDETRLLFATPGIVLQRLDEMDRWDVVIFDEFHERRIDTDLLLALLSGAQGPRLIVMSATLDGPGLASHLGGEHVEIDVPLHPVEIRYLSGGAMLPAREQLVERTLEAIRHAERGDGDVLVFLPGKAEIQAVLDRAPRNAFDVLALHGDLSLREQARVLSAGPRRRLVLCTNVAETSLTVPGVRWVIDAGLVRRTRYREGRGQLALVPVAQDSAAQRAGRAGRTAPGTCLRLWSEQARLEPRTPPEILRESLVPLVLACAERGQDVTALPFVDAPPEHAIDNAQAELSALGALDAEGHPTRVGRELFRLPIDAHLGRLLVQARSDGSLGAMIDLVAVLAVGRPLFRTAPRVPDEDRDRGHDPALWARALRGDPDLSAQAQPFVLQEAKRNRERLRRLFELEIEAPGEADPWAVLRAALRADPRLAHVARRRGKQLRFSNGGTELELSSHSAASALFDAPLPGERAPDALVVLDTLALAQGARASRMLATCAAPITLDALAELGLGRERVARVERKGGKLLAVIETVHARAVLRSEAREPEGTLAREAVAALWLRGSLWPAALKATRERLLARSLAARLGETPRGVELGFAGCQTPPAIETWIAARLAELGLEHGDELTLLSPDDLTADDLPFELRAALDEAYPRKLSLGDATYAAEYDLEQRQVLLRLVRGQRDKPPPRSWLPAFDGLKVCIEAGRTMHVLPPRRG